MKKVFDDIKSNGRQIVEIVVLVAVTMVPFYIDLPDFFKDYLESNPLSPDNFLWHIAITYGKYVASVIFFFLILLLIRKFNNDFVMNRRNEYHD